MKILIQKICFIGDKINSFNYNLNNADVYYRLDDLSEEYNVIIEFDDVALILYFNKEGERLSGDSIYTFKLYSDKSLQENDAYYESLDDNFSLEDILHVGKKISFMEELDKIDQLKEEAYKARHEFQKKKEKRKEENKQHVWSKDYKMAKLNLEFELLKKSPLRPSS